MNNIWIILVKLYGPFFNFHNWESTLSSSNNWLIILSLIIIESLLSVDNSIVLASQASQLNTPKLRTKALFYGLLGAYLFRFLIIGVGVYLIKFWLLKLIGSLYLFYLVYKFFYDQRKNKRQKNFDSRSSSASVNNHNNKLGKKSLWMVVVEIELMDIVFSIDSVLASLAVSSNPIIVLISGCVGILTMRGVANLIIKLMKVVPELQPMAYLVIFLIAMKLFLSLPFINIEIPTLLVGLLIIFLILATVIFHFIRARKA